MSLVLGHKVLVIAHLEQNGFRGNVVVSRIAGVIPVVNKAAENRTGLPLFALGLPFRMQRQKTNPEDRFSENSRRLSRLIAWVILHHLVCYSLSNRLNRLYE
jgi:hypothetical protein